MKCLFIYPTLNVWSGHSEGICILSALLKQAGHNVKLLHINENFFPFDEERIKEYIRDYYQPGAILFSVVSNQYWAARIIARSIRTYSPVPLIIGGIHATSRPEECLEDFDIVCRGEGEGAVVELVNALEEMNIAGIKNLWLRQGDKIIRNSLRPFIDLSSLPPGDRTVFDYQRVLDIRAGWLDIMAGRGCPRACSYCYNRNYAKLYQQDEHSGFVRIRRPEDIIAEIGDLRSQYSGINTVSFYDDSLTINAGWLESFCSQYRREVKLPFSCAAFPLELTDDTVRLLKNAGCLMVRIGVETASEDTRHLILNRPVSNRQISDAIERVKSAGIKVTSYSMIGIPSETKDDVLETLRFNAELGVNQVRLATLCPYQGTPIYDLCIEQGLLDPASTDRLPGYTTDTILNYPQEFKDFLSDVQAKPEDYLNMFCQGKGYKYQHKYAPSFAEKYYD